jgi:hypothetical protein
MVASLSVVTFLLMRLLLAFFYAREEVMNAWPRFRTLQVWCFCICAQPCANQILDMPEKEATYIITNGGINDPEKV